MIVDGESGKSWRIIERLQKLASQSTYQCDYQDRSRHSNFIWWSFQEVSSRIATAYFIRDNLLLDLMPSMMDPDRTASRFPQHSLKP